MQDKELTYVAGKYIQTEKQDCELFSESYGEYSTAYNHQRTVYKLAEGQEYKVLDCRAGRFKKFVEEKPNFLLVTNSFDHAIFPNAFILQPYGSTDKNISLQIDDLLGFTFLGYERRKNVDGEFIRGVWAKEYTTELLLSD